MKHVNYMVLLGAFGLLLGVNTAFAQPAHAPAHGARDNNGHQEQRHHKDARPSHNERNDQYVDLPRVNERELIRLLREFNAPATGSLPPGIQRQIERGKPLPPGIAKRFDRPLAAQLPSYPGYEWEYVGSDVVLIEAATRVVVDILVDALR
ncbi:anti-virulence regulator CigR family protein [Halomonas colorata]|uniref:anti-virulence regulator CigR family protein n=1 Tax=Halomonas colorata TaxID=2742615 RepID=UPI001866CDA7|nr:anti-virulence regulator CigR family protein [Halomonas colorata]